VNLQPDGKRHTGEVKVMEKWRDTRRNLSGFSRWCGWLGKEVLPDFRVRLWFFRGHRSMSFSQFALYV